MPKLIPTRRMAMVLAVALITGPTFAQTTDTPPAAPQAPSLGRTVRVDLETAQGRIVLELYPDRAPVTVANFLRYVRGKRLDGVSFYRAVRTVGAMDTGFIQGGVQNDPKRVLPSIAHEPTTRTGLAHKDGTITMARGAPGSASGDFVIMVGPASYMDADPAAAGGGDNLGYAAFGQVVEGMEVVKKILVLPADGHARNPVMRGQILDPPVKIISARIEG